MKRPTRGLAALSLAAAACLAAAGCSSSSAGTSGSGSSSGTTYTIGLEAPLSGTFGIYGVPQKMGAQLAVNEINSSHYLGNNKLKLVVTDDQSTAAGAIAAYKSFASGGALGVLCCVASTIGTPLKPLAVSAKVPTIITGAAAPGLPQPPYVYRTVYDPSRPGSLYDQTIDAAATNWKPATAVVVYSSDSDSFGGAVENLFVQALARNHIKDLKQIASLTTQTDFSSVASQIVSLKPDLVVADTFSNATANLMRSLKQFGYTGHVVSSYGVDSLSVEKIAGPAMAGVTFAPAFSLLSTNPTSVTFVKQFKAMYGSDPDQYGAEAYNSMNFLALGIKNALARGPATRQSVAAALSQITTWKSTNGDLTMSDGNSLFSGKALFVQWDASATESVVWGS